MNIGFRFAICAALAGVLVACGPAAKAPSINKPSADAESLVAVKPDAAIAISPNTYQYKPLGLTVVAPDGWYVAPSDVMGKMMDTGVDITSSNMDPGMKAAMKNAVQRTVSLFTFTQHPPGAAVEYTAGVMGVTEDVGMLPGIERGSDYFFHARKMMAQSAVQSEIEDGYTEVRIGGQAFDRMDLVMGTPPRSVKQRYFAARHRDTVVAFIQSYRTDEDLAALDKVLDSIKLDW